MLAFFAVRRIGQCNREWSLIETLSSPIWGVAYMDQAARLRMPGYAGYPDEADFVFYAAEAKICFELVQPGVPAAPVVYGREHGKTNSTLRRVRRRWPRLATLRCRPAMGTSCTSTS